MITDIRQCHAYIPALLHAMLAETEEKPWDTIIPALKHYYHDTIEHIYQLQDDTDLAYILKVPGQLILSTSGTRGKIYEKGWRRNFNFKSVNGFHRGFKKSFDDLIKNALITAMEGFRGKFLSCGHSAGDAINKHAIRMVMKDLKHKDAEHIGYCGPVMCDAEGKKQMKGLNITRLYLGKRDQVDNFEMFPLIRRIVKGVHVGYSVLLPDVGDPGINDNEWVDDYVFGHAPTYVCRSLIKLCHNWGFNYDAEINDIMRYAVK